MLRAHKLADEGILGRPRFNMDDVLNEAKKSLRHAGHRESSG